jgi:pSer/pThr/pTyr-binding forkhead associated (FHA) protein
MIINSRLKFEFNKSDCPITIGREGCNINIKDKNLSKTHCIISHLENNKSKWVVDDGDGIKPSKNGTWILERDCFKISDETIVRIGSNTIKFKIL